jgi:hypothetical protein
VNLSREKSTVTLRVASWGDNIDVFLLQTQPMMAKANFTFAIHKIRLVHRFIFCFKAKHV